MNTSKRLAFTLVELLVVIAIIGILIGRRRVLLKDGGASDEAVVSILSWNYNSF